MLKLVQGDAYDPVVRPSHYVGRGLEAIQVIDDWGLGFALGNAVKYLLRAGRKGAARQDVEKALWYVRHAVGVADADRLRAARPHRIYPHQVAAAFDLPPLIAKALEDICVGVCPGAHTTGLDFALHLAEQRLEQHLKEINHDPC